MTLTAAQIDQIVREVVRRLQAKSDNGSPAAPAAVSVPAVPAAAPVPAHVLRLHESVITLASLEGRWKGVRQVIVPARAVITPSVKDELRRRHVTWERAAVEPTATNLGEILVIDDQVGEAAPFLEVLRQRMMPTWHSVDGPRPAVAKLTERLTGSVRRAVCFSGAPFVVACEANRNPRIRAAYVMGTKCVTAAIQTLQANVLVVNRRQPLTVDEIESWLDVASTVNTPSR
ncbi:MAG: hypothetical protein KDA60_12675 [Planctomycetales bacterium]|nr:hypothetical protein [Planctomycetales bacterium]